MRTTISAQVLAAVSLIADREIIHRFFDGVKTVIETLNIAADDKRLALTARKDKRDLRLNINGRLVYAVSRIEADFRWRFMLREADLKQLAPSYVVEAHRRFAGPDGMFLYEVFASQLTNEAYEQLFLLCLDACTEYLPTQNGSPYRSSHQPELYEMALDPALRDEVLVQSMEEPKDAAHLFEHFIAVYKDLIRQDHNEPERYKWVCTQTFQEAWDIDAPDFEAMLKAALRDRSNLLYQNSSGFILKAAKYFPENVREMFRHLFNEDEALTTRLRTFTQAAASLLPKVEEASGAKLSHQQDERTISFYLAMRFPESYPLYKQDLYYLLLKAVANSSDERRRSGERFLHFLELGDAVRLLITADEELQTLVADTLTDDCWKGPQQWLIFQDILWRNRAPVSPQLSSQTSKTYAVPETDMQIAEESAGYAQSTQKLASLNTILYGPPGTGKTFYLQNQFAHFTDAPKQAAPEEIESAWLEQSTWWEVIAHVLYHAPKGLTVPELRQQRLISAKFGAGEIKNPAARLWSTLQHHTVAECPNVNIQLRLSPPIFWKEAKNSVWRIADKEDFKAEFGEIVQGPRSDTASNPTPTKRYRFTTAHQSWAYEDFVEGIKPILQKDAEGDEGAESPLAYHHQDGLFYEACDEAAKLAGFRNLADCLKATKAERKVAFATAPAFGFFIDEINRANISAVLGELITLLEADKRLGAPHEIADTRLPYSRRLFGVPANLYVIGTMNTADRSVEALDTALRRRFSFVEMPPKEDLIEGSITISGKEYHFSGILRTINTRMEVLAGRDHRIGHSYFLNLGDDWKAYLRVFTEKIIPLLQEYFYGDYSRMCLVLGTGFVSIGESDNATTLFAKLPQNSTAADQLSALSEKEIWALTDWTAATEDQFATALDTLLNS